MSYDLHFPVLYKIFKTKDFLEKYKRKKKEI
jgi:hypothetical protein